MTKTYSTDALALHAAHDHTAFEELVGTSEGFILRCASSTIHRLITLSDDEWSIALGAFASAVNNYNPDKGHFYPFAELVIKRRLLEGVAYSQDNSLHWEIEALGTRLSFYGIAFVELAACSPHSDKTKRSTAIAIAAVLHNPTIMLEMQTTHILPISAIVNLTSLPPKILERHRKYIIAAAEIFDGGYDGLSEYIQYVGEELK